MTNPELTPCWFRGKTAAEPFVRGRIVDTVLPSLFAWPTFPAPGSEPTTT